jgi:hypothetical protein
MTVGGLSWSCSVVSNSGVEAGAGGAGCSVSSWCEGAKIRRSLPPQPFCFLWRGQQG